MDDEKPFMNYFHKLKLSRMAFRREVFRSLITGFVKFKRFNLAIYYYRAMVNNYYTPSSSLIQLMSKALLEAGRVDDAALVHKLAHFPGKTF